MTDHDHSDKNSKPSDQELQTGDLGAEHDSVLMDASESSSEVVAPLATEKGFFNSFDGTSIYYEVAGEGRPIIFCYGLVCRREHWRHQLAYFVNGYKVITFDYRGHHRSALPSNDRNLTLECCAKDVQGLIEHLDLKETVVFGHSMGVPVSAIAGSLCPEKILGLVLICGSVSNPFHGMFYTDRMDKFYQMTSKLFELAPGPVSQIWRRMTEFNRLSFYMTSRLGFNPYLAEERDVLHYMEGVNQTAPVTFFSLLRDYTRLEGRPMLKKLKTPTLVIAGAADFITPMHLQEEMARLLPKGVLEKIPMGSHNAHTDLPEMVNQKIENFLERIDYR